MATSSQLVVSGRFAEDPVLGPVMGMGKEGTRVGGWLGVGLAALFHGYVVARVMMALFGMLSWVHEARSEMHEFFWATYEVEDIKKGEEKKEEPAKEEPQVKEEQATEPKPIDKAVQTKVSQPQAQPQNLAKNLYDDDKPSGGGGNIVDRSGEGAYEHIAGEGDGLGGGKGPGFGGGEGGGIKKDAPPPPPPPPPPPSVDRSAPATLVGSKSWSCPFPPEADAAGKDSATVQLVVTVGPSGSPESVQVVSDPGTGFGRAARVCALGRKYKAGLDRDGNPTRKTTPPITVRFSR